MWQGLETRRLTKIEIYTTSLCGFCANAKRLLKKKGVVFTEYDVTFDRTKRQEMMSRAEGRTSVPQIFIGGKHVGGCDDLFDLEFDDELDPMLGLSAG